MNQAQNRILVIDDEAAVRMTMMALLHQNGYLVESAATGEAALALIAEQSFEVVLLDLKLPGMDGIEVARRVRACQPNAAVIILTGHGSLDTVIDSLRIGVFDYMLKTFSPEEVMARVALAVRERQEAQAKAALLDSLYEVVNHLQVAPATPEATPIDQWITVGGLQISLWHQQARLGDQTLHPTPIEFRMLRALAQQAGRVLSYQQILQSMQGYEAAPTEAAELIKPHMYHLRQKIEDDPANPRYLLTVRGAGYMLKLGDPVSDM